MEDNQQNNHDSIRDWDRDSDDENLKMRTVSGIMNLTLRNLKMITLRDLKMIMSVIRMALFKLKKMLLQEEEIMTWVLEEIDKV